MDGLSGLDRGAEDLAGGQHAAEEEQGGQDQEVGAAVQGQELSCLTSKNINLHIWTPLQLISQNEISHVDKGYEWE